MEIKASCTNDLALKKVFARLHYTKKIHPVLYFILLNTAAFILFFYYLMHEDLRLAFYMGLDMCFVPLLTLTLIFILNIVRFFRLPKQLLRLDGKLANCQFDYTFCEQHFVVNISIEGHSSTDINAYSLPFLIKETNRYLFIYRNPNAVYVVDKETLSPQDLDTVRSLLCTHLPPEKYIRCNY